jgi:hypothetical protein
MGKDEDEQRLRFEEMLRNADLRIEELWLRYFSFGGIAWRGRRHDETDRPQDESGQED